MKYPTVSALCEGVAGAIREKEGSSARINPQDFVDRIEALEVGGGIPDVPTLECWKITPRDIDDVFEMNSALFVGSNGFEIGVTEMDGHKFGGLHPILSSSSGWAGGQIFYIAFINKGDDYYANNLSFLRDVVLNVFSQQISLSEFLSVIAQIEDYE